MLAPRPATDTPAAATEPDRIAPPEPPGIMPLPVEPDRPALPETEPPRPDTDEPGILPEEYPEREDDAAA